MRSLRHLFILLLSLVFFNASSQDYLERYLEVAAENNPGLQSRFNEYLSALEVVPQVGALPDPKLAFGYFIRPVETRLGPQELRFSVSQMFPWFGTLDARKDAATLMAKARYEAFEEAKSSLFYEVRASYYNLYFTGKAIDITLENLDILQTFRKLALIKVEAGLVSPVDEYRIEIEIGELENQLALLKDNLVVQTVKFNNLLNVENSEPIEIPSVLQTTELLLDTPSVFDSIRGRNHQLLNMDFQIESLKHRQEVARKSGLPDFSVGLDYIMTGKGDNNLAGTDALVFPVIGITVPLYRNKYKAMVNEVMYLEASKQNERANKVNMLETIFANAHRDMKDAVRRLDLYRDLSVLAKKSLQLLEMEYLTNNANFEEILRMERQALKYSLEIEKARADNEAAVSFIHYLMGK